MPLFSPVWRKTHRRLRRSTFALAFIACGIGFGEHWVHSTELPGLEAPLSGVVQDRNGETLRITLAEDGRWRLPAGPENVDPDYIAQLVAYEDKRFYNHPGVDPIALMRAGWEATLAGGRIQSGGSTLTMQVARLLEGSGTGRWAGKLRQMRVALALERRLTKDEILAIYLTLAPFGGNLEGVEAASYAYLSKSPKRLTMAEAAFLVALPQAPETRRPDRAPDAALAGRNRVLKRLADLGHISVEDATRATHSTAPTRRRPMPNRAPHLGDRLAAARPNARILQTTLDAELQMSAARTLRAALRSADGGNGRLTGAVIIAELATGKVRATASGATYTDTTRAGFIDMTRAIRSPGSTLKPLIYALAFENGIGHPETLIDDRPMRFGDYAPTNFDGEYRGTLSLRQALVSSRNIPAVALLERVGPAQLTARMRRLGAAPKTPNGSAAGLALALGGAGLSLENLVTLYAALGGAGQGHALSYMSNETAAPNHLIGPIAAYYTGDILRDAQAPGRLGRGRIAYKTGTSYGHRDAWAIGFDGAHVVGVWLGRADAGSVPGLTGQAHAAPLLMDVFDKIPGAPVEAAPPPRAALTLSNSELPRPLRHFQGRAQLADVSDGPEILSPPDGARVALGLSKGQSADLVIRLGPGGQGPFTWLVNGEMAGRSLRRADWSVPVSTPGFMTVTVIDGRGHAARTRLELQ